MFYAWRTLNGTPGLKREDLMTAVFIQSIQRLDELEWKLVTDGKFVRASFLLKFNAHSGASEAKYFYKSAVTRQAWTFG